MTIYILVNLKHFQFFLEKSTGIRRTKSYYEGPDRFGVVRETSEDPG